MDIETIIMSLVGAFIAIFLVGSVIMPTLYAPTLPTAASFTNSSKLSNINKTQSYNFTLTNIDSSLAGTLTVAFQGLPAGTVINASIGATQIQGWTNDTVSPKTLTIPAAKLTATTTVVFTANAETTSTGNITSAIVSYYHNSESSGWGTGVQTFWSVLLGIAVVAMLVLFMTRLF